MSTPGEHSAFVKRLHGFWPLGPIFNKELRQMARRKRSYAMRFCYLGVLLGILSLVWYANTDNYRYRSGDLLEMAQLQSALGRYFFIAFAMFSIVSMQLIGPILTSTAIGSERLRRTLDVLLMTPINSWQIVTGKLFSRLISAMVLIGLTLPVLAIVRLLGGVELYDMFGIILYSTCTVMASAALGLLLSCWMKRAWAVILLSYMIMAAIYAVFPGIAMMFIVGFYRNGPSGLAYWILGLLAIYNPTAVTMVNTMPGSGVAVQWTHACIIQLVFTAILTFLASIAIRRVSRKEVSGDLAAPTPLTREMVQQKGVSIQSVMHAPNAPLMINPLALRLRFSGKYPILQHELNQPLFRKAWQRTTCATIVIVSILLSYVGLALNGEMSGTGETQIGYAFILYTLFSLMCIVLSSTAIATEKESDTWTLLIVSPVSGREVLWGKFAGILRRMFWPMVLIAAHFSLFAITGIITIYSFALILWVTITFNALWIATGIYLSLRAKRVTTAVVLNLLLAISIYAAAPMVLSVMEVRNSDGRDMSMICMYWLPYWYLGEGTCNYTQFYEATLWTPGIHGAVARWYVVPLAFLAGLLYLAITLLIMYYTGRRFDKMVERADSGRSIHPRRR